MKIKRWQVRALARVIRRNAIMYKKENGSGNIIKVFQRICDEITLAAPKCKTFEEIEALIDPFES
jgi:hypothetical protein